MERLSWTVALAGFPFLLFQVQALRKEQHRIADELTKAPRIDFGFLPESEASSAVRKKITVEPRWASGKDVSEPVQVVFVGINVGERTARNLVYNLTLPYAVSQSLPAGPKTVTNADRSVTRIEEVDNLHPGAIQQLVMELRIPTALTELEVNVAVSMDDTPERQFRLEMEIRRH
jgi:hypothetical protein